MLWLKGRGLQCVLQVGNIILEIADFSAPIYLLYVFVLLFKVSNNIVYQLHWFNLKVITFYYEKNSSKDQL